LNDDDKDIRRKAAAGLGLIGPKAKDAIPVLIEQVKKKNLAWQSAMFMPLPATNALRGKPSGTFLASARTHQRRLFPVSASN
jgi:HEAT repeat protein